MNISSDGQKLTAQFSERAFMLPVPEPMGKCSCFLLQIKRDEGTVEGVCLRNLIAVGAVYQIKTSSSLAILNNPG